MAKIKIRRHLPDNIDEDIESPDDKINKIHSDVDQIVSKSEQVQKAFDNLVFRKKVRDDPITMKHYAKGLNVEYIDLGPFLNMRLWTRGIYTTDKLVRLGYSARLEFLKRYLEKKKKPGFDLIWLLIIIIAVVLVVVVIIMLLPKIMGG